MSGGDRSRVSVSNVSSGLNHLRTFFYHRWDTDHKVHPTLGKLLRDKSKRSVRSEALEYMKEPEMTVSTERNSSFCASSIRAESLAAFRSFLRSEFSDENIEFWLACEKFRAAASTDDLRWKAEQIYEEFIRPSSGREVGTWRRVWRSQPEIFY